MIESKYFILSDHNGTKLERTTKRKAWRQGDILLKDQ